MTRNPSGPQNRSSFCPPLWKTGLAILFSSILPGISAAQDRQVFFDTTSAGVSKAAEWGLDTAWHDETNLRRGSFYMGGPQKLEIVRVSFTPDFPIVADELQLGAPSDYVTRSLEWVNRWSNPATTLYLNESRAQFSEIHPSYLLGDGQINPVTWAKLLDVTTREYQETGRTVVSVGPVNEADFQTYCSPQTHFAILGEALNYPRLNATRLHVSTLNPDAGINPWYDSNKSRLDEGVTHQLAGSFDNYANYFQTVRANGDHASNDELHNVMEAMVGVEYGMQTGIWWGTAELARGEFVKANKGVRLAYAEDRPKWSAAAVYRAPDGKVQGFVGESERQSIAGTYQFVAKDRSVFFDGNGPQRTYTVQTSGDATYWSASHKNLEKVVNITWGEDVPPPINGRYLLVARHSGKVMEVAGSGINNGDNIRQNTYNGGLNQQWDIGPIPYDNGGDNSYYRLTAAHSGKAADGFNFSLENGGDIRQWEGGNGINQVYYFEYVEDGWFRIRNRWSGKCLDVANVSTANNANIQQWEATGGSNQQWRLIPASVSNYNFVPPTAPVGLVATANPASVNLSWAANTEADLNGYHIYASSTPGGPYEIIARNVVGNLYTDSTASKSVTRYYRIKAVDASLNRSGYSTEVNATPSGRADMVAHYSFAGNLLDQSSNGNHGSVIGTESYAAGQIGQDSLAFNSSNHVLLPPAIGDHNQWSFACWVYWNGGARWQRIFDFGNGIDNYLFLSPQVSGGGMRFAIKNGGPEQQLNSARIPIGLWTHVAVTLGAGNAQLYVNGALTASQATTIKPSDFKPVMNYLGKSQWPDPLLNGRLDDVRIYNHALSSVEVASLANPTNNQDTVWTGAVSQDWKNPFNWNNGVPLENGTQRSAFINTATGNFPSINSAGTYQADWDIVVGGNSNGRLDQSAGTVATGDGSNFFLGLQGAQTLYNQTGSGSLRVGGVTNPNGNMIIGQNDGTVSTWNLNTTGTAQAGGIFVGSNGASTGVINAAAGTVDVSGEIQVGGSFFGNGGTGQLNMTGGTVTANVVAFGRGGSNAAAISSTGVISGGTLNSRQWFNLGFAGSAANVTTVTNNGGTININTSGGGLMEMGVFDATTNLFTLDSGSVSLQNNASIGFGQGGNHSGISTITQNGGSLTFFSDAGFNVGGTGSLNLGNGGSTGTYAYNLNGGTLTTPSISKTGGGANGSFNFNGGTLVATGSTTTFMQGLSATNIQNGGAIINTNGSDITIAQALLDAGTGGLTKQGTGTLTLAGANTYDGNTIVQSGGKLILADNASLRFVPGANGVNNQLGGNGALQLDGDFTIDVTSASTTTGHSWTLVNVNALAETYGSTFTVSGWKESSPGTWVSPDDSKRFTEATGILDVVNGDLDSDGMHDLFEQIMIAANPGDNVNTINDVLPQADFDGDGTDNLTEFRLGLVPTNSNSRFFIASADSKLSDDFTVTWQGKAGLTFKVERSATLASGSWSVIHTVKATEDGRRTFTDPAPLPSGKAFYRVVLAP